MKIRSAYQTIAVVKRLCLYYFHGGAMWYAYDNGRLDIKHWSIWNLTKGQNWLTVGWKPFAPSSQERLVPIIMKLTELHIYALKWQIISNSASWGCTNQFDVTDDTEFQLLDQTSCEAIVLWKQNIICRTNKQIIVFSIGWYSLNLVGSKARFRVVVTVLPYPSDIGSLPNHSNKTPYGTSK